MSEPEDREVRREAERRADMIVGLREHVVIYVVGMLIILGVWIYVAHHFRNYFPWFLFPMFGWGFALLFHARSVYGPRRKSRGRENLVQREMERLKAESIEMAKRTGEIGPEELWSVEPPALDRSEPSPPHEAEE